MMFPSNIFFGDRLYRNAIFIFDILKTNFKYSESDVPYQMYSSKNKSLSNKDLLLRNVTAVWSRALSFYLRKELHFVLLLLLLGRVLEPIKINSENNFLKTGIKNEYE